MPNFVARNESSWNRVSKTMKSVTEMTYGGGTHEAYEVTFNKRWVPVERWGGWVTAGLGGMQKLEVLGARLDLRQVFQLEWMIVSEKSGVFIFESNL